VVSLENSGKARRLEACGGFVVNAAQFTRSFLMFFTPITPAGFRRQVYASAARPPTPFMEQTKEARSQNTATVEQDEQSYTLSFDVPGVSREQLVVGIEGNVVRLSSAEGATRQYRFACELPQDIDATQSAAKLENGVLTLKLAKVVPVNRVTELVIH
jgi:HSP20 family molecular chaperone IbpA